ncbi:MAG: hypothetical protein JWP49_2040 [Phenylobacterium sp.]|nr:hypothetical protein [Phenylobacterium sp.]
MLRAMADDAATYVQSFRWAPPITELLLAFGVGKVIGLFLVRYAWGLPGEGEGDTEQWVVVGDLPSICFETDVRTPADALRLYCAIAQDWADNVMVGRDLSQSYPIAVEPTREHAELLLSRIASIREMFMPIAGAADRIALKPM